MQRSLCAFVSACLAALTTLSIAGELQPVSLTAEGWSYHPVFDQGAAETIVAIRSVPAPGVGIIGLYCTHNADDTWTISAWDTAAPEEIVIYAADQAGVSREVAADAFADIPLDTSMVLNPVVVGVEPQPFSGGLKSADPMQQFVQSSADPETTLEILEMLGYPAVATLSGSATTSTQVPIGDPTHVPTTCIQLNADQ